MNKAFGTLRAMNYLLKAHGFFRSHLKFNHIEKNPETERPSSRAIPMVSAFFNFFVHKSKSAEN